MDKSLDDICPLEHLPCNASFINGTDEVICLQRVLHCNGENDCPNGEDESYCVDDSGRIGGAFAIIHEKLKNGTKLTQEYAPKHCTIEMYFKGECSCNLIADRIVFCENSSLTQIPDNLNTNITKLLRVIESHYFQGLNQLKTLYLEYNEIKSFSLSSLTHTSQLKLLYKHD
ncbi:unnamed protein product [Medioppia subpectinata]|uniref:Uncharacterized protein n=1 Tax=Medioppia subpectinata TaxID=1979941 RepID=A0A7R9L3I2_9ACAR|nr:unnamed protein product [Medioppia subpectinata]CAG2114573.1 unnamed protein product [Medioppia subpectinata]